MKQFIRIWMLLCFMLACLAGSAFAQNLDNQGKEFFMAFLPNLLTPTIEIHLTSSSTTNVTVEYPANAPTFSSTVSVAPGAITIVTLPNTASQSWSPGIVQNNLVRAFSSEEFVAYMINVSGFTSDAALALPTDTYNTEFFINTYDVANHGSDASEFALVAAFDNTTVTVTPKSTLVGGFVANTPFDITLNKGQGFLGQAFTRGPAGDLTGSLVTSDRPISVTNGNRCTNIPSNVFACDHIFEVAQPTQTWGKRVMVRDFPHTPNGAVYRILASVNNTSVLQNGTLVATLNRGESYDTGQLPGTHEFSSNNAIFVTQYMPGISANNTTGDPAMGNMVPTEQYQDEFTFSTVGGTQFSQHGLNIIAENGDVGVLTLDGVVIPASEYTAIGTTGYSSASVTLTEGTHTTTSPGGHSITVYGTNNADSYLYPAGGFANFINPVGDPYLPVCSIDISSNSATGSATDNTPSEDLNGNHELDAGEDTNNNGVIDKDTGIFLVELRDGSENVELVVTPFEPGDGSVSYTVNQIDPLLPGSGTIRVIDGAGNFCEEPVEFSGEPVVTDDTDPLCEIIGVDPGPPVVLSVMLQDTESGISHVNVLRDKNADVVVPSFTPGTNEAIVVTATKINPNKGSNVVLEVFDMQGNSTICDPVYTTLSTIAPQDFQLEQNYPNPFNPTTTIRFGVAAEQTFVSLKVYDISGREVRTLINEQVSAGQFAIEWDGKNNSGQEVAGGIYLYRLTAGNFVQTRKMTFLK
ncbi:MAG: FlgD immunoglobulin-like domain containing protein [Calditrichia bacterium]